MLAQLVAMTTVAAAPGLQAGVARVDLTPPASMKAALGGYGERMSRPAEGVHDRVWAKALVIRSGETRLALVTADVLAFPPGFKDAVLAELKAGGWRSDEVLLLASHTHASLDMTALDARNTLNNPALGIYQPELRAETAKRIASAVVQAGRLPVPVTLGWSQATLEGWVRNRRGGPTTNPTLTVGRLDTLQGKPLAVVVHWAAHPTFVGAGDMLFSGEWPGYLQRTLETLIGGDVTALYMNGAEGDQSPVARGGQTCWERAETYGQALAIECWRAWQGVKRVRDARLEAALVDITLPARSWHPDFMKTGGAEYGMSPENAQAVLEAIAPAATHGWLVRLGDMLVIGVPGEMAADVGLDLRLKAVAAAGMRRGIVAGLADEWISYILSPEEYRKGGYEASVSTYGETLGPTILGALVRAASEPRH